MDIILFLLVAWWLSCVLGFRKRGAKRRHRRKHWYDSSYRDDQNYRW